MPFNLTNEIILKPQNTPELKLCHSKQKTDRTRHAAVTSRYQPTLIRCFVNSPLSTLFSMSRKLDRCWRRSFFALYLLHSVDSLFSSVHKPSNPSPSKSYSVHKPSNPSPSKSYSVHNDNSDAQMHLCHVQILHGHSHYTDSMVVLRKLEKSDLW